MPPRQSPFILFFLFLLWCCQLTDTRSSYPFRTHLGLFLFSSGKNVSFYCTFIPPYPCIHDSFSYLATPHANLLTSQITINKSNKDTATGFICSHSSLSFTRCSYAGAESNLTDISSHLISSHAHAHAHAHADLIPCPYMPTFV